jgi:hypothetical protein
VSELRAATGQDFPRIGYHRSDSTVSSEATIERIRPGILAPNGSNSRRTLVEVPYACRSRWGGAHRDGNKCNDFAVVFNDVIPT